MLPAAGTPAPPEHGDEERVAGWAGARPGWPLTPLLARPARGSRSRRTYPSARVSHTAKPMGGDGDASFSEKKTSITTSQETVSFIFVSVPWRVRQFLTGGAPSEKTKRGVAGGRRRRQEHDPPPHAGTGEPCAGPCPPGPGPSCALRPTPHGGHLPRRRGAGLLSRDPLVAGGDLRAAVPQGDSAPT